MSQLQHVTMATRCHSRSCDSWTLLYLHSVCRDERVTFSMSHWAFGGLPVHAWLPILTTKIPCCSMATVCIQGHPCLHSKYKDLPLFMKHHKRHHKRHAASEEITLFMWDVTGASSHISSLYPELEFSELCLWHLSHSNCSTPLQLHTPPALFHHDLSCLFPFLVCSWVHHSSLRSAFPSNFTGSFKCSLSL